MWTSILSDKIRIDIFYEAIYEAEYIIFWNFNGKDVSKGVKELEVVSSNSIIWRGKVNKGVNNIKSNYSTNIPLSLHNFNDDRYNFDIGGKIFI